MRSVKVTAPEALGLTCPFTGKALEVYMHVQPGSVTFSAPDAFTLAEPVESMAVLIDRATTRNGVAGAIQPRSIRDPYTGSTLRIRELGDGRVCYVGGFNPRAACSTLGEFLYRASMRDGKTDMVPPMGTEVEKSVQRRELKHLEQKPDDFTMEVAERAVEKSGMFNRTTVHVSKKGRK